MVARKHVILGLNITHGYVMANIITSKSGNIKEDLRHHAEVLEMAMSSKISSPWLEPYKSEKMWVISPDIQRQNSLLLPEVYRWAVYRSKRQCPYTSLAQYILSAGMKRLDTSVSTYNRSKDSWNDVDLTLAWINEIPTVTKIRISHRIRVAFLTGISWRFILDNGIFRVYVSNKRESMNLTIDTKIKFLW